MLDAEKVERLRRRLGLSQEEAAIAAGLKTRQRWHNIVSGNGDVKLSTLAGIAKALRCDAKELLKD